MNRRHLCRIAAALVLAGPAAQALADVEREDIIVLDANGRNYTSYKTLRSELAERVLYLGPDESPDDAVFIVPDTFDATPLDDGGTRLHFQNGSFALMNTGVFDAELEAQGEGVYTFSSWDGVTRSDGHLGKWNAPDDFASFSYTWVVPANIEILDYSANRSGTWEQRDNTLNWTGKQVNDIAFTVRYRVADMTSTSTAAAQPQQTQTATSQPAPAQPTPPSRPSESQRQQPPSAPAPRPTPDLEFAPATGIARIGTQEPPAQAAESTSNRRQRSAPAATRQGGDIDPQPRRVAIQNAVTLLDGRPRVTDRGQQELRRIAAVLPAAQLTELTVYGPDFADSRDTGGSVAQAAQVADYLAAQGIPEDRIVIRAGSRSADATGSRIEIEVVPGGLIEAMDGDR